MAISKQELNVLDGYFRAANYLSVAMLYLQDNPLLKRKLELKDIKNRLVGHFGSAPAQNFIYAHLDREIVKTDKDVMLVIGPGHAGESMVCNSFLEGTYRDRYKQYTNDSEGLRKFVKDFSFPGGTGSHVSPIVPGSIHEGGELGYSLVHAYGAVLDNPDLICACIVGDGEAETGPLSTSWHLNKFINAKNDGAVLPILNLNGYKIANPTILSRISRKELLDLFKGYGYYPIVVEGETNEVLHEAMAKALDESFERIKFFQDNARNNNVLERPIWPMIILVTPKGWTGPKEIDGKQIEGSFRSHQIPFEVSEDNKENLKLLEDWLLSYKPEELFDEAGNLHQKYTKFIPRKEKQMSATPYANGGELLKELKLPSLDNYGVEVKYPGEKDSEDMRNLGKYLADVVKKNKDNFRIFGPDEALSNRLNEVFNYTNRVWDAKTYSSDEYLAQDGRVMDGYLSEHVCEGLLEGYLLTGRHGLFHSYEAFIRVVDSMISQHAKWIKMANEIKWRKPIASLNLISTSYVWQQDHNGYTHQDPGIIDHILTKKSSIGRVYLPCDTNTLIATVKHCLGTKNYVNLIVASKHLRPQWLTMDEAIRHTEKGLGIFGFASNDLDNKPDIVMAAAGVEPTLEVIAATSLLRKYIPNLKVRVVNVCDLTRLMPSSVHPHGISDREYDYIFTKDKPIVFAFHGYPQVIHELTYKRTNKNLHVRGYREEGNITTPFDMRVLNRMDRFSLALKAIEYLPNFDTAKLENYCKEELKKHKEYIRETGKDLDEVLNFKWDL